MVDSRADSGTVFISYSHRDATYLARLQEHLTPYVRSGAIPLWDDTQIQPGDDWKRGIEQALDAARIALLLVSVSFLASEFVAQEELPKLLAAAEGRGTRILPVILTPCLFRRTSLSRFQAVNDPARPLSGLSQHEQDLVWERVVETVLEGLGVAGVGVATGEQQRIQRARDSVRPKALPPRAANAGAAERPPLKPSAQSPEVSTGGVILPNSLPNMAVSGVQPGIPHPWVVALSSFILVFGVVNPLVFLVVGTQYTPSVLVMVWTGAVVGAVPMWIGVLVLAGRRKHWRWFAALLVFPVLSWILFGLLERKESAEGAKISGKDT